MPMDDISGPQDPSDPDEAIYGGPPEGEMSSELADSLEPSEESYTAFTPPVTSDYSGEEGASEPEKIDTNPEGFDPRWRDDFEGLLYIGHLSKKFVWMGHRFVIRTLTTEEVLEIAQVHKPFVGGLGEVKAYQAATVAACLVSVDGRALPIPVTNEPNDTLLQARFDYVIRRWSPIIQDVVYNQYLLLEARVNEVLIQMGKAGS